MADGLDLLRFERAAHPHDDRGRRFGRFARKQRPFRQHQMDPRRLDPVDGADGAGQFALKRAQVIDVLDEAGGPERVGFVENLVADAAALGQAALGELHAQPGDLVLRHHDDGAVVAQFEGNGLAFQVLDDGRGILDAEVGKEGGHLRRGDAHDDEREETEQRGCHRDHRHQPRSTQTLQEAHKTLQTNRPSDSAPSADWAIIAYGMVSIWLTKVKGGHESSK
jgi:hypothetical protein